MGSNSNQEKQAGFGGDNMYQYIPSLQIASTQGGSLINATSASINSGGTPSGFNDNGVGRASSSNPHGGDNMYQYIPSLQIASTPGGSLINATSASINSGGTPSGFNDNGVGRASSSNPQASMNKRNGSHQKQRFIWTQEHHQSFLEVIELLEAQNGTSNRKVVPRKILEEMRKRYPNITRENIASHLQKHRLHLKNLNNRELNNSATSLNSQLLLQSPSFVINPNSQSHKP
ncbi:two-component response regulator ARR12-like [Cucurbita moschata]|uniref:Two-component response regulator ARR12-like n=1 Tax=Cucurbita moschata TaxID=3662 RepID=A0A6J1GPK7_CUCMO|nr:two-component response regulator ARR12-like [Cucurbita moschata]